MKSKAVEQLTSEIFILNQIHSDTKKEKLHDYIWAIDNFGKIILWKPTSMKWINVLTFVW